MSTISIGDYVGILDGTEKGYVIKIEKNKVWIETEDGFEIMGIIDKLVKYAIPKNIQKQKPKPITKKKEVKDEFQLENLPAGKAGKLVIKKVTDKDFKIHPSLIGEEKIYASKKHHDNAWEIDLHIEEIIDHFKHLTNAEILNIQLRQARMIIEKARKNKVNKLVFIHGKGKGILKEGLLNLLSGYTYLEYYDASFKKYGGGATEVKLFLSKL